MIAATVPVNRSSATDALHAAFLVLLPRIERQARFAFREVRCPDTKEDKIREMGTAVVWQAE